MTETDPKEAGCAIGKNVCQSLEIEYQDGGHVVYQNGTSFESLGGALPPCQVSNMISTSIFKLQSGN